MKHNLKSLEKKSRIGIVIPSFNSEKTISECIDSILNQNFDSLNILVVDGKSNDSTVSILKKYKNKISWISEKDKGQTDAINKGMKLINSHIVKWVNSDDMLISNSLASVNECFNYNIDFVYGDIQFINSDGDIVGYHKEPSFSPFILIFGHNLFADPTCFWKSNIFNKTGYLNTDNIYSMDFEFWLKCLKNNINFFQIKSFLAQFRIEENNKSIKQFKAMRKEHYKLILDYFSINLKINFFIRIILFLFLICARIYKKIKILKERSDFNIFSFSRNLK